MEQDFFLVERQPLWIVVLKEFDFPCGVELAVSPLVHSDVANGLAVVEQIYETHERSLHVFAVVSWKAVERFGGVEFCGRLQENDLIDAF